MEDMKIIIKRTSESDQEVVNLSDVEWTVELDLSGAEVVDWLELDVCNFGSFPDWEDVQQFLQDVYDYGIDIARASVVLCVPCELHCCYYESVEDLAVDQITGTGIVNDSMIPFIDLTKYGNHLAEDFLVYCGQYFHPE